LRGAASFWVELLPLLFGALFILGLLVVWRTLAPWKRLLATLALGAWLAFFVQRTLRRVETRQVLAELEPSAVERVELDGQELQKARDLVAILGALRHSEGFSVNHGGWSHPVRLRVTFTDGHARDFDVARYLREPGAVIAYVPPGSHPGEQEPLAFSPALPGALASAGIALP
jgi:hypothetical protein